MRNFAIGVGNLLRKVSIPVLVLGLPFILWLLWGLYGVKWFALQHAEGLSALGQTGDLFGGVNALFAAFAFAGVAVAAYFQYRTNELQKRALTITSIEPLFFHLLEMHRDAYDKLSLNADVLEKGQFVGLAPEPPGRVSYLFRHLASRGDFPSLSSKADGQRLVSTDFAELLESFDELYLKNEDQLGPYYRVFYHVFNLIDKSELTAVEKARYANIARSTVNKDELLLLMLNCSRARGEGFKRLVERYGLLKHISTDESHNFLDRALASVLFHENATKALEDRAT